MYEAIYRWLRQQLRAAEIVQLTEQELRNCIARWRVSDLIIPYIITRAMAENDDDMLYQYFSCELVEATHDFS